MHTLILDTSDNKRVKVGLKIDSRKYILTEDVKLNRTQVILPLIDRVLKKHSLSIKDLSGIKVNRGPGSFTGLRVGLAIANLISFALKIPINGSDEIVLPIYASKTQLKNKML